jgi:hypothetical protein
VHTGFLVGEPKGDRPLGRSRHGGEGNIIMDLKEIGWENMDWINPAQNRGKWWVVNTVIERSGCIKCREFLDWKRKYGLFMRDSTP